MCEYIAYYESKIYTYRAHFHIEHLDTNTRKNTPLEKGENNSPLIRLFCKLHF